LGGLRPQWAIALFAALSEEAELVRPRKLQIASPKIEHFLHAGSGIEHGGQQGVVPTTVGDRSVDASEHRFDLGPIKIFNDPLVSPFERDTENTLSSLNVLGMVSAYIAEKRMNGGEPDIARRHTVFTVLLQMYKEREDPIRLNVIQLQVADFDLSIRSDEAKQKDQAVAIAVNGVRAHSAKPR